MYILLSYKILNIIFSGYCCVIEEIFYPSNFYPLISSYVSCDEDVDYLIILGRSKIYSTFLEWLSGISSRLVGMLIGVAHSTFLQLFVVVWFTLLIIMRSVGETFPLLDRCFIVLFVILGSTAQFFLIHFYSVTFAVIAITTIITTTVTTTSVTATTLITPAKPTSPKSSFHYPPFSIFS